MAGDVEATELELVAVEQLAIVDAGKAQLVHIRMHVVGCERRVGLLAIGRVLRRGERARRLLEGAIVGEQHHDARTVIDGEDKLAVEPRVVEAGLLAVAVEVGAETTDAIAERSSLAAHLGVLAVKAIRSNRLLQAGARHRSAFLGDQVDDTARLIAVERRRRPAEHLYPPHRVEVDVDQVLRRSASVVLGNAIHENLHAAHAGACRTVGACAGAADDDARSARGAQFVLDADAGNAPQRFLEVDPAPRALDVAAVNDGNGRCDVGQPLRRPRCGDDDVGQGVDVEHDIDDTILSGDRADGRGVSRERLLAHDERVAARRNAGESVSAGGVGLGRVGRDTSTSK